MSKAPKDEFIEVVPADDQHEGTCMESVDEIREAAKARGPSTFKDKGADADTPAYRPQRQASMAVLCVVDGGPEEGEWLRLRGDKFVIGRTEGDLIIPNDAMMSTRHAEISRQLVKGVFRWYLSDLQSTNGTYVRLSNTLLRHGQEVLLGSLRYRFDAGELENVAAAAPAVAAEDESPGTRTWQTLGKGDLAPSLVELRPQGVGRRFPLRRKITGSVAIPPCARWCLRTIRWPARVMPGCTGIKKVNGVWRTPARATARGCASPSCRSREQASSSSVNSALC